MFEINYRKTYAVPNFGFSCFDEVIDPKTEDLLFWRDFNFQILLPKSVYKRYIAYS